MPSKQANEISITWMGNVITVRDHVLSKVGIKIWQYSFDDSASAGSAYVKIKIVLQDREKLFKLLGIE